MASVLIVAYLAPATSDVPLLLARAFGRLGWPADVFAMDEELPSAERVLEPLGIAWDHPRWLRLFNARLRRHLTRTKPAALLLFGSNWKVTPDTLAAARRAGTATALWECNHRFDTWFQRDGLRHLDAYFDLDSHFLEHGRAAGVPVVEQLPGCADPDEHFAATLTAAEVERYGADVSFVGSPYPERLPFLAALAERRLRIWGFGWDGLRAPEAPALVPHVVREPVYGLKKTKIYRASAINLNVQGNRMVHGENFRLFEVAACDSFCLTTPKADLMRWFRRGDDLETFSTVDELRSKVAALLPDATTRAARAARARATVLGAHTYAHRAAQIVDALGLGRAPRAAATA